MLFFSAREPPFQLLRFCCQGRIGKQTPKANLSLSLGEFWEFISRADKSLGSFFHFVSYIFLPHSFMRIPRAFRPSSGNDVGLALPGLERDFKYYVMPCLAFTRD